MWQVVLAAAAAAGSGILAKKLIHPNEAEKPISDSTQIRQGCDGSEIQSSPPQGSAIFSEDAHEGSSSEEKKDGVNDSGEIFRFSSTETGNNDLKKKVWSGFKGLKKTGAKRGKKSVGEKHSGVDQRGNVSGKKVSLCLKKRRTCKVAPGKCESCATKDNSFSWGVGLGIMYMMLAGKADISRLNSAMEETGKVVQELKAEISRRKSLCDAHTEYVAESNKKHTEGSYSAPLFTKSGTKNKYKVTSFGPSIEEGECGSSGVTEDQQPELLEMDRLEAELESELQKLPWCNTDDFLSEGRADTIEADDVARKYQPDNYLVLNSHQYSGVLPTELDNKLCHVLIEQQESQISELEAELHQANSRLHEKEAELEALKNCVKRLSEFSLASAASDEEIENKDDVKMGDGIEETGFESTKSTAGVKRAMEYDPQHGCC